MKKKNIVILVIFILIILCTCLVIYLKKDKEYYITDNEYLYDVAVDYLYDLDSKEINETKNVDNYKLFISYDAFGITEDKEYKYAYMWILKESYGKINNKVENLNGSSIFYKFKFKDNKVISYQIPKDGNLYKKSIKKMCPNRKICNEILNYNLKISNDEKVKNYYDDKEYEFKAKIIEAYDKYIIVESLEKINYLMKGSKIRISIERPINGINDFYVVGNIIKITYNGMINLSEPSRIDALKIELVS